MATNYLPTREAELVTWCTNFNDRIQADATQYGLTLEQGAAMNAAQLAFVEAYQAANEPTTRTSSNIEAKNNAKTALIALTRELVNIIQAFPGTTDPMRVDLGITVRDTDPTPVPVPDSSPLIEIRSVTGYTIALRLQNTESSGRAKPAGVIGAAVFSYVGDAPPTDLGDWKFEGNTSQTLTSVTVPGTVAAGSKVWLTSFWFNTRAESGPATPPVSTNIQGGGLSQAA